MIQKLQLLLLLSLSAILASANSFETKKATDSNGFEYEYVTNFDVEVRTYTLENGLTVILAKNDDAPRVQTFITVKAGSTYDPIETTGLAHYLEHMMFKGTSKIGSLDWEKEKVLLKEISDLYEQLKAAETQEEKTAVYAKIDSISSVASNYAAPNEYDKLISSLGAKNTNAYTTNERTVYINDIPSNEMERFLTIEGERFSELVLRLFHTELEAVYEEFNISQDSDWRKQYYAMLAGLFPTHQYGTQTTIGKAEHLKNPSMENIHKYWNTYYVPNNMALSMMGDLDFDQTIKIVNERMGSLKPAKQPEIVKPIEEPIKEPKVIEVFGPNPESLMMAFRTNGIGSEDELYLTLIDYILCSNGRAGLIDLNLTKSQKVLEASSDITFMKDYGFHMFMGNPRQGQSLEEVKDLILGEIEKVKKGQFEDWMLEAVINDMKLNRIKAHMGNRFAHTLGENFANNVSLENYASFPSRLENITKEQVVEYANKFYNNNYVVVYKRVGADSSIVKVPKPEITPIDIDRSKESEFLKEFKKTSSPDLQPLFVDFEKEINSSALKNGVKIDYIQNPMNDLFSLYYIVEMGSLNNKLLPHAINYLNYIGTKKYNNSELNLELFKYGLEFEVSTGEDRSYVKISGLQSSFEKGVEIIEELLATAVADTQAYKEYVYGVLKSREDAKLDKETIFWKGMISYGKYGAKSPFTDKVSASELLSLNPKKLTDLVKELYSYDHKIFYYGPESADVAVNVLNKYHKIGKLKPTPEKVNYPNLEVDKSVVYFVNYDMVQADLLMLHKGELFNKDMIPFANLFNEYFGSGLSSIVFQEIRESRALAYSAMSAFSVARKKEDPSYTFAYVGTSPDKLTSASSAMLELMNNMPKAEQQFQSAKEAYMKRINSERIIRSNIYFTYLQNLDRGINYDYRKEVYDKVQSMSLDELDAFFNEHIANKQYIYLVMGNKNDIDFEVLKKLGDVKELTLEEIFGE